MTRGGEYKDMPYEMGDRYLRTILGFFGIEDIQTLAVDNTDSSHSTSTRDCCSILMIEKR